MKMFSVLMSVYAAEEPAFLAQALESLVVQDQTLFELVLIRDGPLGQGLVNVLNQYAARLPMRQIELEENVGLAKALNKGLEHVATPWVMRFDSDDVCAPDRLSIQAEIASSEDVDFFGAQIEEFEHAPGDLGRLREVPLRLEDILRTCRRRNPFNHVTVCFKTALVRAAGGYPCIPYAEDYALWAVLLAQGARTMNTAHSLVSVRVGAGMYARRGGHRYVQAQWAMQKLLADSGLKSWPMAVLDGILRSVVFYLPSSARAGIYQHWLRR
jgi:glycosyltransferase involved in cell wall biosynthesis